MSQPAAGSRRRSEIVRAGVLITQLRVFDMRGEGGLRPMAVGRDVVSRQTL